MVYNNTHAGITIFNTNTIYVQKLQNIYTWTYKCIMSTMYCSYLFKDMMINLVQILCLLQWNDQGF